MSRPRLRHPIVSIGALALLLAAAKVPASAAPGDLDLSFSGDGRLTASVGSSNDTGSSLSIDDLGRLVLGGWVAFGPADEIAAIRVDAGGTVEGAVTVPVLNNAFGRATVIDSAGRIVVVGSATSGQEEVALVRINPDGSLDVTFGIAGVVTTPVGTIADAALAVALDAAGRIVVAGRSRTVSGDDFLVARYLGDGSLDSSFSGDGIVLTPIGSGDDVVAAIAIDSSDRIVVAGTSGSGSAADFALARYDASGNLDSTFGSGGLVTVPIGSDEDAGQAMAIDGYGRIVVAGWARSGARYDFAVARFDVAGALDSSFGTGGTTTTAIGPSDDRGRAAAIDSGGRIVVAGSSRNATDADFAIARYGSNGILDTSFGTGGVVTTPIGSADDVARALAIDSSARLVLAGSASNGSNDDFALARYDGGDLNLPPAAAFSVSPPACEIGETVSLDASGSFDSDSPPDSIVAYDWDFDGDGFYDDCHTVVCNAPCTAFPVGPSTVIRLVVRDSRGGTGSTQRTLAVDGCQNGILDPGERCDDGNAVDGDGCSAECGLELRDKDIVVSLEGVARILRIDPVTGAQAEIASGAPLVQPSGVALDVFGELYVADATATGTGAVIHVDVATGTQTVVTSGAFLTGSVSDLAFEPSGQLVVTRGAATNGLIRVNPGTGAQSIVSSGGLFVSPKSVAVSAAGDIFVFDAAGDRIIKVNPTTGAQTLVSSAGLISLPGGIGIEASGQLVAADRTTTGPGGVYRVHPTTGAQTAISSGGLLVAPSGIDVEEAGSLILVNSGGPGAVIRVNATSGAQTLLSSGGLIGPLSDVDIRDIPVCGNSFVEPGEHCDDGNTASGDCCSALCRFETGAQPGCNDGVFCTNDVCDGAGSCIGIPDHGACNDASICSSDICTAFGCIYFPTNGGVSCRSSTGVCDVAETCTGTTTTCPTDALASSSTVCRASAGACDPAETCTGSSAACPANAFAPNTTTCRASAGVCDLAETCSGTSAACPADSFAPSTMACRASAGVCDLAEACTGTTAACPANAFVPSTTTCRASAGVCDVAETCTGTTAACPGDAFLPTTITCRASAGVCDLAETCSGTGAACPSNAFAASSTVCRAVAGACDLTESCTGSTAACPADTFRPSSFVCRAAASECDQAETCTGSAAVCPVNAVASAGTACTPDASPCTTDACDGAGLCAHPAANAGTTCRVAVGICDVAEVCDGVTTICPPDTGAPDSDGDTVCDALDSCKNLGTGYFKTTPKPKLILTRINNDGIPGNDFLILQGLFDVATDQSFSGVNPMVNGARILLLNQAGGTELDVTLPGGEYSGLGTRGWRGTAARTKWVYRDQTTDGSTQMLYNGISQVQIIDKARRIDPRQVLVKVRGFFGNYPVIPADSPVQAVVVLGNQTASIAGLCGESGFTAAQCAFDRTGKSLQCKK